eukprot:TRINITY_DN33034_c0_g1_i1.p1 TRINITY_DN33034_c0_g1~~TRINITY_DN33034_c0_g1_i1.p1  ORF type:complete len:228 (+),score=53.97 TRINITY_DN33034_c0_g1_i1:37-684(+)
MAGLHPHFITGDFKAHPIFLGDDEYARALDCLIKACCDMIVTNAETGQILTGKRKVEPQPDWWFVGGRMKPGERVEEAGVRILRREIAVNITDLTRFKTVGHYSFVWAKRAQEPKDHGTADISVVSTLALTPEEIASMKIDMAEYDEVKFVDPSEILTSGTYHPALAHAVGDMLSNERFRALEAKAVDSSVSDAEVRSLLVEYLKQSNYSNSRQT